MPLVYDDSIDNVQNQPGTTLAVTASSTSSVYVTGSVLSTVTATLANPVTTTVTGTIDAVFSGSIPVYLTSSTTTAVTTQNPSLTGVALKAANVNRKGLTIYNQTSQALYVKMGTTATLADFTLIMDVSGYYESPFAYNGAYWGIQGAAATGLVYVTEVT